MKEKEELMNEMPEQQDVEEDQDNIVTLSDEDGNDVYFEFLDLIEYEGEEYVVLLPMEDNEEDSAVVILKIEEDEDDAEDQDKYVSVDDEATLGTVFEIFKEKNKKMFNFVD